MKINDLKIALAKKVEPLYLVVGTEDRLIHKVRQLFLNILATPEQEINFSEFDLEQVNVIEAVGEANSLPFFGDRRLIFITNPVFLTGNKSTSTEQDLTVLSEYLNNPQSTTTMVIFAPYAKLDKRKKITKLLQQKSQIIEVNKLSAAQTTQLIKQQVMQKGYQIEPQALENLIARTNNDFSTASAELNKLFIFAVQNKTITSVAVQQLVAQSLDDNVFDLLDAILQNNLHRAESCYRQLLLLKNDPIALTALAQTQIRLLLQVKILANEGMTQGKLAQFLQVHPYRIKLALQRIDNYSLLQLKKAHSDLIEMDYQMKTGQGDKERLFELFFINFITNKKTA
ncbi:DNA polymerase III subunit delta [Bombilactobacillus thymidiniphilus]|uniref:DNA polymerase III subunit delta n=1 Tax=Bombilactobacillus thymidiniphilus TaxID=2923363 RepID=A0ABY4PE25_9LACO|nr:DNA polymerase III subunit delta [Bombilactobacillus thymidiniphilus]UQS83754.1 DNA polymerase III subunit delta [Bombilactobacillus thymidiniphilus]